MGGSNLLLPSFYQPKISPAEVVSPIFLSIQMLLRRVSKRLESFKINQIFFRLPPPLQTSVLEIIKDLIM